MTRLLSILILTLSTLILTEGTQAADCAIVDVTELTFSEVDTLGNGGSAAADITVSCTEVSASQVTVCIGIGNASSPTDGGDFILVSGDTDLRFGLYTNDTAATRWGSAANPETGSPYLTVLSANGGVEADIRVHGLVPGGQRQAEKGSYSGSLPVSLSYQEESLADCASLSNTGVDSPSLIVTAEVEPNCLIQADDIDFGTVGLIDAPLTAQGGLEVTCTPGAAYTITMGEGKNFREGSRHMSSDSGMISYGLFRDASGNTSWDVPCEGDASGNDDQPVWGRVPPQQAAPGAYSDTVTVTINYQ